MSFLSIGEPDEKTRAKLWQCNCCRSSCLAVPFFALPLAPGRLTDPMSSLVNARFPISLHPFLLPHCWSSAYSHPYPFLSLLLRTIVGPVESNDFVCSSRTTRAASTASIVHETPTV